MFSPVGCSKCPAFGVGVGVKCMTWPKSVWILHTEAQVCWLHLAMILEVNECELPYDVLKWPKPLFKALGKIAVSSYSI